MYDEYILLEPEAEGIARLGRRDEHRKVCASLNHGAACLFDVRLLELGDLFALINNGTCLLPIEVDTLDNISSFARR